MKITSLYYFVFLAFGVFVYYVFPKKNRWVILLGLSILFYMFQAIPYTIVYLIATTAMTYLSTNIAHWAMYERNGLNGKWGGMITAIGVIGNIFVWFLVKGTSFYAAGLHILHRFFPVIPVASGWEYAAALGMGYYTAQAIGYIMDCYWKNCLPEKNILKVFLFLIFFPQLTVGPISRRSQFEDVFGAHKFSYEKVTFGMQRMMWGLFKKLVISDRIGILTAGIWGDTSRFNGIYIWMAVLIYPIQIYTDFSGCMDIVLGSAELFGVYLPENFKNPFFSRTSQEFWQRWHITLGLWAKDYVYYPVLKSRAIQSLTRWSKKHFRKRTAKLIPWAAGMGILWIVMGLWHGSFRHIFGVSVWYWTAIVMGEIFSPLGKKVVDFFGIKTKTFSWHLFQSMRTYFIYAVGALFFSASSLRTAIGHFDLLIHAYQKFNPWVLFDGSILQLGITYRDLNILVFSIFMLLICDILCEKFGGARKWIATQSVIFRWCIWCTLFLLVMVFGIYGPGYHAADFIYQGF